MARAVHKCTQVDFFLPEDGERGIIEGKQGLITYDDSDVKIIGIDGEMYRIPILRFVQLYDPPDDGTDARVWEKVYQRVKALRESG